MSKTRMSKLALGLFIGSVAGISAALLAAPQSGQETRAMLREKGVEIENKASESLATGRDKAKVIIGSVRENAGQMSSTIRNRLNAPETKVEELVA